MGSLFGVTQYAKASLALDPRAWDSFSNEIKDQLFKEELQLPYSLERP